jgi:lipopolysaccharide exporter
VSSSSLSATIRRGALWSIASTALLKLASVLTTAVIARILDPRDFGIYAVALTAYGIVNAVGEFGLGLCLIRADLDIDSLAPTMATIAVTTNAIQAGIMFAFARPIATALGSVAAAGPIRVLALAMLITGVFAVPGAQLIRDFKQNKIFLANLIGFVPSTAVLVLLAISGSGAIAFAWSMVVGNTISGCVVLASVGRHYRPGFSRGALGVLVKFGFPLAGANIVNYVLLNGDYAVVGHLAGAVALGAYVLAFNVASWPYSLLGFMVNNVSMPAISRVKDDAVRLKNSIARALRAISLVVMPMSALTITLARPLVLTLYGTKWTASVQPLSILACYGAISIICVLFANILAGLGRAKFILMVQLVWLAALVPGMVLGVHRDGIFGAAIAHVIVIGPIVLPIYLFGLRKVVDLAALARAVLPALLAAAVAALAAAAAASQFTYPLAQLIAGLATGGLVYFIITVPYAVALLNLEQNLRVRQILRPYNTAAWLVGLPAGSRSKHAVNSGGGRARQVPGRVTYGFSPGLVTGVERPRDDTGSRNAVSTVAGYPLGLADAYDQYSAPLYGYCHWMLNRPADAAEAVERTFATVATELGDLRDLDEVRPWLYRAARDECYRRLRATGYFWSSNFVSQPANFGGDSRQAELRTLIGTILGELKPHQREVFELSLRRDLNDAELAIVLGVSWSHAHALSSRARSHLEDPLRALLIARTGRGDCPVLDELLTGWDGQLTEQTRDLVVRHIGQCQTCADHMPGALRQGALSVLLPSAAPPPALREQVLRRCAGVTPDTLTTDPEPVTQRSALRGFSQAATLTRRDRRRDNHKAAAVAVVVAVIAAAAVSGALLMSAGSHPTPTPTLAARSSGGTSGAASTPATVREGLPARGRVHSSPSPKHSHPSVRPTVPAIVQPVTPTERATPSPKTSPSRSPKPSPSRSASPSPSASRSPSASAKPSTSASS